MDGLGGTMKNEFLNTEELAAFLGIKPQTINIWRMKHKGPSYIKIGRNVRYKRQDIESWIENCRVQNEEME